MTGDGSNLGECYSNNTPPPPVIEDKLEKLLFIDGPHINGILKGKLPKRILQDDQQSPDLSETIDEDTS